jgi:hypothetical protein
MTTFTDQKSSQDIATDPRSEPEPKHDGLTTPEKRKISGFQYPSTLNRNRKKEAFGAVFLDPMINHDCLTDMNKVVKH